jgi:RNA polymerase sigma-70 factor (ECF subfamily)
MTDVTALLLQWGKGDESALERLIPLVHRELHQIARRCILKVSPEHARPSRGNSFEILRAEARPESGVSYVALRAGALDHDRSL